MHKMPVPSLSMSPSTVSLFVRVAIEDIIECQVRFVFKIFQHSNRVYFLVICKLLYIEETKDKLPVYTSLNNTISQKCNIHLPIFK